MATSETLSTPAEARRQALRDAHRYAIIDFYAQVADDSLDFTKRLYENGKLDELLGDIRVCLQPPVSDDQETLKVIGNAVIPVIVVARQSYFRQHGFQPFIEGGTPTGIEDRVWIRNGQDTLFAGEIRIFNKPTIFYRDDFQEKHELELNPDQAILLLAGYGPATPKKIPLRPELAQFINADGTLITKKELEALISATTARTLDLTPAAFVARIPSDEQKQKREMFLYSLQHPQEFLTLVDTTIKGLRYDWVLKLHRGKIETDETPFYIDVEETKDFWDIHVRNIDFSERPLTSIVHAKNPHVSGDIVVRIDKKLSDTTLGLYIRAELTDRPGEIFTDLQPENSMGTDELITLLALLEPDYIPEARPKHQEQHRPVQRQTNKQHYPRRTHRRW